MPKAQFPLTPAPSAEIAALDKGPKSPAGMYFALPPSVNSNNTAESPSAPFPPLSPTSPDVQSSSRTLRQRTSTKRPAADFTLPPPPTRTRKIIQVKPKGTQDQPRAPPAATQAKGKDAVNTNADASSGSKKKQPSATTAAGRKIARRTAHSLIERRRRSKMNEEFATLKDMIPACKGQEMHKLAILQASIEYVNYLEQCISDLKAASNRRDSTPTSPTWHTPKDHPGTSGLSSYSTSPEFTPQFDPVSSASATPLTQSQTTSPRPSSEINPRTSSSASTSTFEIIPMILPSPALRPSNTPFFPPRIHRDTLSSNTSTTSLASTTTSPVIPGQSQSSHTRDSSQGTPLMCTTPMDVDMDREATAALLMLNIDRRTSGGGADGKRPVFLRGDTDDAKKGISVHDLLSH